MRTIAITGIGMVSSLGLDAQTSCAAARAGLVRPQSLDYFCFTSPITGEPESARGHAASLLTRGFEGPVRFWRLFEQAVRDLQANTSRWPRGRVGWYLCLPPKDREHQGLSLIADDEEREWYEKNLDSGVAPLDADVIANQLVNIAQVILDRPIDLVRVTQSGHVAFADAVAAAAEDLSAGRYDAAIVGGVDSLLEVKTLQWLSTTFRLKTSGNAVGLQPGEAAALVLLEPSATVRARNGRAHGYLGDVVRASEPVRHWSEAPATGNALAAVMKTLAASSSWPDTQSPWVICDHNGESYRALDWGHAVNRLTVQSVALNNPIFWYPVASFGDVGAASGAVQTCVALRAFERGYAPAQIAFVMSAADSGNRSGVAIYAADEG